ncbi:FliH/SctL family protein [Planctomicrobium piriforme]|uniref:Flagellar assembly protein FliH n=1 Tax=Planctomicrobium piriforme TaxID=1576369 RepID=A0A1I3GRK9_9PLAN|nr:FliH/SctL family protein [Planctomicrobium piriforme]SFI26057.1 flagellar assembly protein FliH [Planctomicrobium piriforme]
MSRQQIPFSAKPSGIRLRGGGGAVVNETIAPARPAGTPVPASFPQGAAKPVAEPDLRPLLEQISAQLVEVEQRRQQSLFELQHVAIELSIAVASQLVHEALSREQFAVEELVRHAVDKMGLGSPVSVTLNPTDLTLLQKRLAKQPASWSGSQIELRGEATVARGGCRAESPDGRMLVSDITSRLSEIRRHWMEELDDAQVERRRAAGEGPALRRFPDRRETA